jgi:hypothetical protein
MKDAGNDWIEPKATDAAPRMNVQYQVTPLSVRLQMENLKATTPPFTWTWSIGVRRRPDPFPLQSHEKSRHSLLGGKTCEREDFVHTPIS